MKKEYRKVRSREEKGKRECKEVREIKRREENERWKREMEEANTEGQV